MAGCEPLEKSARGSAELADRVTALGKGAAGPGVWPLLWPLLSQGRLLCAA